MKGYIILVFVSNCCFGQILDSVKSKITHSPMFESNSGLWDESELVSKSLTEFLQSKGITNSYFDAKSIHYDYLLSLLFIDMYPADQIEYHFLNIDKLGSNHFEITVVNKIDFSDFGEDYNNLFYANYIYVAKMVKIDSQWKVDLNLRLNTMNSKRAVFGNYYFNQSDASLFDIRSFQLRRFQRRICTRYNVQRNNSDLIYVIGSRKTAFEVFGFLYTLDLTGLFLKKLNMLVSCNLNPLDKHELTHFYLKNYNLSKFLSEGIAVYEGGSNGLNFNEFTAKETTNFLVNLNDSLKTDYINKFINNKLEGGRYMLFYYAMAGILVNKYISIAGHQKIVQLMRDNPTITPNEFLSIALKVEENNNISFLNNLIVNYNERGIKKEFAEK